MKIIQTHFFVGVSSQYPVHIHCWLVRLLLIGYIPTISPIHMPIMITINIHNFPWISIIISMDFRIQNNVPIYEYTNHTLAMTCSFCLSLSSRHCSATPFRAPVNRAPVPGSPRDQFPRGQPCQFLQQDTEVLSRCRRPQTMWQPAVELSTRDVVPKGESDVKPWRSQQEIGSVRGSNKYHSYIYI